MNRTMRKHVNGVFVEERVESAAFIYEMISWISRSDDYENIHYDESLSWVTFTNKVTGTTINYEYIN